MPHRYPSCDDFYCDAIADYYCAHASHSGEVLVYDQLILNLSSGAEGELSSQAGPIEKSFSREHHLIYRPQTHQGSFEVVGPSPVVNH